MTAPTTPLHDGGPAYPGVGYVPGVFGRELVDMPGMSLRDHFAGLAMQAMVSADATARGHSAAYSYAKYAYIHADAMLAARAKSTEGKQ